MIDVYIGKVGAPEGTLHLEFHTFKEARDFCDTIKDHHMEEQKLLFAAIDRTGEFEELEEVFVSNGECEKQEIDKEAFDEAVRVHKMQG